MDILQAIPEIPAGLLEKREGRRAITRDCPLLFAYIYLPQHIMFPDTGEMTVAPFHIALNDYARSWKFPSAGRKAQRDAFIAPRQSGKTTWLFLILPLWAAAHGHKKFVAAFSDSASQAELHLATFKAELETNMRLKADFPELCSPAKGTSVGRYLMHNRNQIKQSNGFIFMAKGADSTALGMKFGALRPDVLLFDDIEPGESNYSVLEAKKRLETLTSDLFALNDWATVCIIGTTTMPNSIIDQIRKVDEQRVMLGFGEEELRDTIDPELRWVIDQNIKTHYWPAIFDEEGKEDSFWPERFPLEEMQQERHTRNFAKNYMNKPVSTENGFWSEEDIEIASVPEGTVRTIISVDPAVTTAKASDYTGIAVLCRASDSNVYVLFAEQVKMGGESLKQHVETLVEKYDARVIYVETNQGGDLWKDVFSSLPAKFRSMRQTEKKELRAQRAYHWYQKGKVKHVANFPVLEEQMYAFPRVSHDDVVDAVVSGVLYFLKTKSGRVSVEQYSYV